MRLLTTAFVLSGAAGLIYETVWTRYLGLFVGHSAYAQVIVLVIFLGGMAVGAAAVATRSERIRDPLRAYAMVEIAIALCGALFHPVYVAVTGTAYERWFPAIGTGDALLVARWSIAAVLILPQSILLGATFPLLTAGGLRTGRRDAGHTIALLYFANSVGAAAGVLLEGFVLIETIGLRGTLVVAAALNVVVAAMVLSLRRGAPADSAVSLNAARSDSEPALRSESEPALRSDSDERERSRRMTASSTFDTPGTTPTLTRVVLAVSFGTALSSFFYEIGWIRMLSMVLGSATHSFELMLSAFILGLAMGAYWVRTRLASLERPMRLLGATQWAMGVLALATLPLYMLSFDIMSEAMRALPRTGRGYVGYAFVRYGIALAVMLPATFCAGVTLPLITRMLMVRGAGERAIGVVYAVNTLGSIVGVGLAALVLMPLIGMRGVLVAGAVVDIAIGIALVTWDRRSAPPAPVARMFRGLQAGMSPAAWVGVTVIAVISLLFFAPLDPSIISGGVYRHGMRTRAGTYEFLYYRDGRTASVALRRAASDSNAILTLATNGKPDASVTAAWRRPFDSTADRIALNEDMSTQLLLPLVTLAHRAGAERVAVIGQGSGITSHVLLGSPAIRTLETIEIEPHMITASRGFHPANRRVFEDPRSTFVIDDARSYLAASAGRYDLILSEPSNPWVSGVSGLFTVEFYQRIRDRLAPGGVLGQWLHLYEIDDDLVMSVLAAIDSVFPSYDVYLTSNADILIVAADAPSLPSPDWSVVEHPGVREDLQRVIPLLPEHLAAMRVAGRSLLHPMLAGIEPNSDFRPVLDLKTERARFVHTYATGLLRLGESRFDVAAALDGRRRGFGTAIRSPTNEIGRVNLLARGTRVRLAVDGPPAERWEAREGADTSARNGIARYDAFMRLVAGDALSTWPEWTSEFFEVERVLHGGTAGVADERFYGAVAAYVDRLAAPDTVREAVAFMRGLAAWDFAEAARASKLLVRGRAAGSKWMDDELLLDGAVVSRLNVGDVRGAQIADSILSPLQAELTLRERALSALVDQPITRSSTRSATPPTPPAARW